LKGDLFGVPIVLIVLALFTAILTCIPMFAFYIWTTTRIVEVQNSVTDMRMERLVTPTPTVEPTTTPTPTTVKRVVNNASTSGQVK